MHEVETKEKEATCTVLERKVLKQYDTDGKRLVYKRAALGCPAGIEDFWRKQDSRQVCD
jgi:hypothetical protein